MRASVLALLLAGATPLLQAQEADEPRVERRVLEDDGVRIEELRVRGQTQRIVVLPKKSGLRAYEVLPLEAGRDPSQTRNGQPGAAGKRVWQVLSF
jgi:hypothetical protein